MKRNVFIEKFYLAAVAAGKQFDLNPVVMLAQAALESGWGESDLSRIYNNYFGICGYGKPNDFWNGAKKEWGKHGLDFRIYFSPEQSFLDYGRLIRNHYTQAANMSHHPAAFAKEIAYSRYISEVNGDNREQYREALVKLCQQIESMIP